MTNARISAGLGGSPAALMKLGCALMASGEGEKAVALAEALLARAPDDPAAAASARTILSRTVPGWHRAMLDDEPRNQAFQDAISRAVRPGDRVLDIGTGSGLLAMMAARAGAASVTACEAHSALAATARRIVAANGYGDVVQVLARKSTELDRAQLGGGADVIVAEVFSDNLLSEGALATLRHARAELAAPGVRMIPAQASIRAALARYEGPPRLRPITTVHGFDLSEFGRHVPLSQSVKVDDRRLHLCSKPIDLFGFDFQAGDPAQSGQTTHRLIAEGGPANGLVRWLKLQLDSEAAYENRPDPDRGSHWAALFTPFPQDGSAADGAEVTVHAAHDDDRVQIWFVSDALSNTGSSSATEVA